MEHGKCRIGRGACVEGAEAYRSALLTPALIQIDAPELASACNNQRVFAQRSLKRIGLSTEVLITPALIVHWTRTTGGMSLLSLHSRHDGREY